MSKFPEKIQRPSERGLSQSARFCSAKQQLIDSSGNIRPLRNQSLDVLLLLAAHAGTIVEKSEIQKRIWPNVVVTHDSLVQCISEIRKALGDKDRSLLRTYPRQGYLLTQEAFAKSVLGDECYREQMPIPAFRSWTLFTCLVTVLSVTVFSFTVLHTLSSQPQALTSVADSGLDTPIQGENGWKKLAQTLSRTTMAVSRIEVANRNYLDRGMPYWNNQFLWEGYYLDQDNEPDK